MEFSFAADVVGDDDVRVVEQRSEAGFFTEEGEVIVVDDAVLLGVEDLEGTVSVEVFVSGEEDGAHAPLAEFEFEAILFQHGPSREIEGQRSVAWVHALAGERRILLRIKRSVDGRGVRDGWFVGHEC